MLEPRPPRCFRQWGQEEAGLGDRCQTHLEGTAGCGTKPTCSWQQARVFLASLLCTTRRLLAQQSHPPTFLSSLHLTHLLGVWDTPANPYSPLSPQSSGTQGCRAFSFLHAKVYFFFLSCRPGGETAFPFSAYAQKATRPVNPFTCLPEPSPV